jgi:hypothetical protein
MEQRMNFFAFFITSFVIKPAHFPQKTLSLQFASFFGSMSTKSISLSGPVGFLADLKDLAWNGRGASAAFRQGRIYRETLTNPAF